MITLINGPKTVNLKYISRSILDAEKVWEFDEYTVKYRNDDFIIFDSEQKNVYCNNESLGKINYGLLNVEDDELKQKNYSLIQRIEEFNIELTDKIFNENHIEVSWITTNLDSFFYNLESFVLMEDEITNLQSNSRYKDIYSNEDIKKILISNALEYQNILNSFKEKNSYNIWTGIFSPSFIQKVKEELGEENVRVLNIIRNPSVCSFINNLDYNFDAIRYEEDYIKKNNKFKNFIFSIFNMVLVKSLPNVINIKYEDYLKNEKFLLDDKEIFLRNQLSNYNSIINEFELFKCESSSIENFSIDNFQEIFSNFDLNQNLNLFFDVLKSEYVKNILDNNLKQDVVNQVPKNFFEYLGYNPLSIDQIILK